MNKTRFLMTVFTVLTFFTLFSCNNNEPVGNELFPDSQIVIVYDNDVHCAVDGYAKLVAIRDQQKQNTNYVTTVSCGDFISGGLVGAASQGESIIDIMNEVDYDVVTLGNHELDFGMTHMFALTDALEAEVVCSNLKNCQTDEYPYPAYKMIRYGDIDIAFMGFTTTTSGTAVTLSDENGNPLYTFMRDEFYQNAQYFIDEARAKGAEYVIALAHLGDFGYVQGHPSSVQLIENTKGLDAVIDGHEHHVIEERFVLNKDSEPVLLTSSGKQFNYVGMLSINTDGTLNSTLVNITSATTPVDAATQQFVDDIKEEIEIIGNRIVGHSDVDLTIYDENGNRIVRLSETNIGNFCADAFRSLASSDVALMNGGGIRTDINNGDVSFNDILSVMPFGNNIYRATITGQHLMDALEFAVSVLPNESGSFMQVSGLKFDVDVSIPTPVVYDVENDLYSYVGNGERRVSDLRILDAETGEYLPIDLNRTYSIASIDYLVTELGGSGILRYAEPEDVYLSTDIEAIIHYIDELGGVIGTEYDDVEGRIEIK